MKLNVLALPGDGIGVEVTREGVRVLEQVVRKRGHALNLTEGLLGGIAIHKTGNPLAGRNAAAGVRGRRHADGLGGLPEFDQMPPSQRPEAGLLVCARRWASTRICGRCGLTGRSADCSPLKNALVEGVDMIIVRELIGGIYTARRAGSPATPG